MVVRLRAFEEKDAEIVARLSNENSAFFQYPRITPEFLIDMNGQGNYRMLIAEEGGSICGFCGARYDGGIAELGPICVAENYRKKGIGALLLKRIHAFLASMKITRIMVKVKDSNKVALRFFADQGFKKLKDIDCCGPAHLLVYEL